MTADAYYIDEDEDTILHPVVIIDAPDYDYIDAPELGDIRLRYSEDIEVFEAMDLIVSINEVLFDE